MENENKPKKPTKKQKQVVEENQILDIDNIGQVEEIIEPIVEKIVEQPIVKTMEESAKELGLELIKVEPSKDVYTEPVKQIPPFQPKKEPVIREVYTYKPSSPDEKLFMDRPSQPVKAVKEMSNKDIYNEFLHNTNKEFEIHFRGNKIFDSILSDRDKLKFENEFFYIFGKKMLYNGIRIVSKDKIY